MQALTKLGFWKKNRNLSSQQKGSRQIKLMKSLTIEENLNFTPLGRASNKQIIEVKMLGSRSSGGSYINSFQPSLVTSSLNEPETIPAERQHKSGPNKDDRSTFGFEKNIEGQQYLQSHPYSRRISRKMRESHNYTTQNSADISECSQKTVRQSRSGKNNSLKRNFSQGSSNFREGKTSLIEMQQPSQILNSRQYYRSNSYKLTQNSETSIFRKKKRVSRTQNFIPGLQIIYINDYETELQIVNKKQFVLSQLPPGVKVQCKLKRNSSWKNFFRPQFDLYLANGLRHVLSAGKFDLDSHQIFKISTKLGNYHERNLIGSLNANTMHNQYWLVSSAIKFNSSFTAKNQYRRLYAGIVYEKLGKSQSKVNKKTRNMQVLLPPSKESRVIAIRSQVKHLSFEQISQEVQIVVNSDPNWESEKLASDKSFVLIDEQDSEYQYIKLEKESDNMFNLQIQHPFSIMQGMTAALTRFDVQLK